VTDFGGEAKTIHRSDCVWSHAVSKSFSGTWVRGGELVHNPSVMGVEGGGVTGRTDTDYFYFNCPKCQGILQWHVTGFAIGRSYLAAKRELDIPMEHIELEIHCRACHLSGTIKINNDNWQGGRHNEKEPEKGGDAAK
jgi:hypothetical protein